HQQALNEPTLVFCDEVLLETLDELPPTVVAVMILFAIVNVAIFLKFGGLAPWTDVSDNHRVLLTSMPCVSVLVNSNPEIERRALHGVHYPISGLPRSRSGNLPKAAQGL